MLEHSGRTGGSSCEEAESGAECNIIESEVHCGGLLAWIEYYHHACPRFQPLGRLFLGFRVSVTGRNHIEITKSERSGLG